VNGYAHLLIEKIFTKLRDLNQDNKDHLNQIRRMILILKQIIEISEKRGCKVKPHYAVLKGDMIQSVIVEFHV